MATAETVTPKLLYGTTEVYFAPYGPDGPPPADLVELAPAGVLRPWRDWLVLGVADGVGLTVEDGVDVECSLSDDDLVEIRATLDEVGKIVVAFEGRDVHGTRRRLLVPEVVSATSTGLHATCEPASVEVVEG